MSLKPKRLSDDKKAEKAAERAAQLAAEKEAMLGGWRHEARKLGTACRASFLLVIRDENRGKGSTPIFGDDRAALVVFNAMLQSGEITERVVHGISGEVKIYKMKEL